MSGVEFITHVQNAMKQLLDSYHTAIQWRRFTRYMVVSYCMFMCTDWLKAFYYLDYKINILWKLERLGELETTVETLTFSSYF